MEEKRDEASYSHVLKYTGIFGGVQGLTMLISLVRNKFMALLLGAEGMGFASLMSSVQNFSALSTNLGISFGAVPRLSELHEQPDKLAYNIQIIRIWSLIAAALGFLFSIVISPLINNITFTWGNHTVHYAMLGVSVALMAITGGETAILKATRRLGSLAKIQVFGLLISLVIVLPLYYFFRHSGVVPALVLMALVNMLLTIGYSYRCHPLHLEYDRAWLRDGFGMIRLGLAFVIAAAIGSAAEMLIRAFLNVDYGLDAVGFYNAGYMITLTYAGLVFTAMESDYFPRLSAVNHDIQASNATVNRQIEVSLLLLSPMLVALLMMLPVLIPTLFSNEFLPVVGMTQVAVLAMFFKVLTLPVAYITLARGYSMSYLLLETTYYVVLVGCVVLGFRLWGIYGTGVALVAAHVFDFLMIYGYAYWKYSYRSTSTIMYYALVQTTIGFVAYAVSCLTGGWLYWVSEAALTLVSTAYSVYLLRQKTRLWESLKQRFRAITSRGA
ncbi:MAG: oligosaccharide flippase family protein [Prevotella sp.]|nr:oligosaccharide flippase family protein [Prevotella sp.]